MSDGNFNRSLLPKKEASDGIRTGKAQMRAKAEKAFMQILDEEFSGISNEKKQLLIHRFRDLIK